MNMTREQHEAIVRARIVNLTPKVRRELAESLSLMAEAQSEFWDALYAFEKALGAALEVDTFTFSSSDDFTGYTDKKSLDDATIGYLINDAEEIIVEDEG